MQGNKPNDAEESQPQPPASHAEAVATSELQDLDESNYSQSTTEFDVIDKALMISASGGACEAGEAECRKLLAFEQEARASRENSIDSETDALNMEEGLDPLDLVKIVEARLQDSDASPAEQDTETASVVAGTQGYEEESLSSLDVVKMVEARLQDSGLNRGENTTSPDQDNSPSAENKIEQKNHHKEQKVSNISSTGEAKKIGIGLDNRDLVRFDTAQNDGNHGVLPLPPAEPNTVNRRPQAHPGAFAIGAFAIGNNQALEEYLEAAVTDIEPATTGAPMIQPENGNPGLAVANLVQHETTAQDLPHAQDYNPDNVINTREKMMKQFKTKVLLGVIALLAIILILVAILIPPRKEDNAGLFPTTAPNGLPSSSPSQGPSSYSEYWLSLFPESTVSAILEDPESPQSMAFEWLTEEIDILQNLTRGRVVQRFALATFYFANSEERWSLSDNWLSHSVHECLWYSSLEDYYFIFEANLVFPLNHLSPCEQDPAGYLEEGILYQGDGILKHFWLSFIGLMGSGIPPELYLLTELKSLALDGFNLTSTIPEELSGLPSLQYISMVSCGLYGSIPEALGSLSRLLAIYFAFNSLTGTIPSSLFSLTNSIRGMALLGNQLTGPLPTTEVEMLTDLQVMWLGGNLFTGTIPTELGQLTLLNYLGLEELMLSGSIPNELAVLTDMALLQLDNSGLLGTIPRWLGNMTSMDTLTLSDNSFTGTIPTELGLLTKMWTLWLGVNALSGTIPSEFGMYEEALVFTLHSNDLTGTIPTEFGLLTGLDQVWLFDNNLTGTVPWELGNVPFGAPYGHVFLDGNDLSGIIPESLCSANNLTFDCSTFLCGCDSCNCSDFKTLPILEEENTGQLLSEANQTEGNRTEP
ncbi:LRR receptor-like serine threonine-protein kinase [Seminavis robusta]|uniref:LRR receptor-like serine threonine-protein kinase n=1 Tax=Seminavis robusta TaxID=568900 RepID=A0A9N8DZ76_9STRA|nr:LRR receptor-like serine threonine-protein kinase [Seminavis robusta]|eukprot:Sro469_g149280.1 LRR receptor-like serine threonine-protein kinase (872) ;mRNA; r:10325-13283